MAQTMATMTINPTMRAIPRNHVRSHEVEEEGEERLVLEVDEEKRDDIHDKNRW